MKNLIAAAMMFLSVGAIAQEPGQPSDELRPPASLPSEESLTGPTDLKRKATAADTKFVNEAAQTGMAEVEMGRAAKNLGKSDGVKDFGQKLIDDHQKANRQLEIIAGRLGIPVPTQLDAEHKKHVQMLNSSKDADFDSVFARHMVEGHEKAVQLFTREAKTADARDLRDFAQKTLPTLQEHLKIAKDLRDGRTVSSL
jgi:putative membrane protein